MSPTLHKLLVHSVQIIKFFLPFKIGSLAEDAAESWHRLYRLYLIKYARQIDRIAKLIDGINRGIYESDPVISKVYLDKRRKYQ